MSSTSSSSCSHNKRIRLGQYHTNNHDLEAELKEARAKTAARASLANLQGVRESDHPQQHDRYDGRPGDTGLEHNRTGGSTEEEEQLRRHKNGGEGTSRHPPSSSSSVSDAERTRPLRHRSRDRHGPIPARSAHPAIMSCSSVDDYEKLNHIEEGTYGVVFRARHKVTGEIVALKKLKMDRETNGFPITSLREIRTLMMAQHENVVRVKEVVVGQTLTQIFIVFEFIEHDIKTLITSGEVHFTISEIKTLVHQLLSAVCLLHSQWIIHRDLKTSNLLMNNRGTLKLADFGLARLYSDSPTADSGEMTSLVVTLWYRAPELLLGATEYDTAIDMWSVGCIFAEFLKSEPLFTGKNESDQLLQIFSLLGHPTSTSYPPLSTLPTSSPISKLLRSSIFTSLQPYSTLRSSFPFLTSSGQDLLGRLLTYDPLKRITAKQALEHVWFAEHPRPAHPDTFGTFPSWAAGERKKKRGPLVTAGVGGRSGNQGIDDTPDAPGGGADRRRRRGAGGGAGGGGSRTSDLSLDAAIGGGRNVGSGTGSGTGTGTGTGTGPPTMKLVTEWGDYL